MQVGFRRVQRNRTMGLVFLMTLTSCSQSPTLKAIRATQAPVETTITTTSSGTIDAEQQAVLGFGVSGRVQKLYIQAGNQVKKGQILAELENSDLRTILDDAQKEMARAQQLFREGLYSQAALDLAKKNFEIARANLDKTIIRAPFTGLITEVNLEKGELSQPTVSKPPIRIIDLQPRLAKGNIDEVDLSRIKEGSQARVKIPAVGQKYFDAVVTRVIPFVSTTREQDRTSEIELKLNEDSHTLPVGASADIEVIAESKPKTLSVPTRTVLGKMNQRYVYKVVDHKLKKTPVQLGIGNYDRSEIQAGISEGDLIIFPPDTLELKDGMKVKTEIAAWP